MARSWLLASVLLLLLLFSAATTLPHLRLADDVSPYEERFGALRPLIPEDATLSFLTNVPSGDAFLFGREHFLAQYVLAPAIVVRDAGRPYVLVDVYADLPPLAADALAGLEEVVDLGTGVALYRKTTR